MTETDIITKLSHLSVTDTVAKLTGMNHRWEDEAARRGRRSSRGREAGPALRRQILVVFGQPSSRRAR